MTESRTHRNRCNKRTFLALAAALSIVTAAPGAMAQGFYVGGGFNGYEPPPPISPRSVAYRLQDRGFTEIGRPRFDGTAYVIDATNPVGARVRLFVDARDGVVLGRQRLDAPYYPSARPARPGYGWTEEDMQPRRTARIGEGLIPPGNIPDFAPAPRPPAKRAPDAGRDLPSRSDAADINPLGVNPDAKLHPDAKSRAASAPRKTARLSEPQKPAAPRVAPVAPKLDSADKVKPATEPDTKPATATVEPPAATSAPATTEAPAQDKAAVEKPAAEEGKAAAETPRIAEAPKKDQAWHDPPATERKVRVIDGATVVPGGGETPQPSAN